MPEWATISIREELVEEIRKLLKRTGRYRSISEFVAEAIRLRLEEINRRGETVLELPQEAPPTPSMPVASISTVPPGRTERSISYLNAQLQRAEQTWWILVRLFGDLVRKDVKLDDEYPRQLRNCRNLMNFVRSRMRPESYAELASESLPNLKHSLENMKRDLIAAAICVSGDYAHQWISEIDRTDRGEVLEIPAVKSRLVLGLPRNGSIGWTRITLSEPLSKERVEEISKLLGVSVEPENNLHFVVRGEKKTVKKAVEMIYKLQSS